MRSNRTEANTEIKPYCGRMPRRRLTPKINQIEVEITRFVAGKVRNLSAHTAAASIKSEICETHENAEEALIIYALANLVLIFRSEFRAL